MIFRNRYDLFFLISDFEQILKPLCKFFFVDSVKNIVRVLPVVSQIPCRNPQIMRHKIFRQNVSSETMVDVFHNAVYRARQLVFFIQIVERAKMSAVLITLQRVLNVLRYTTAWFRF